MQRGNIVPLIVVGKCLFDRAISERDLIAQQFRAVSATVTWRKKSDLYSYYFWI